MAKSNKKKTPVPIEPPRHVTAPTEPMTLPSLHRQRLLPLVDVGSRKFEELCCDLLRKAFPDAKRCSLKRDNGVQQYGVDVEGFGATGNPFVVLSAKCYRDIKGWHFRPWIKDFVDHLDDHWSDKSVKHFVLAVTHECNDDDMNDSARGLIAELARRGIQFELWNTHSISELLALDPRLVDRYFHPAWVQAISADVPVGHPSVENSAPIDLRALGISLQQITGQIEGFVGHLSEAWSRRLDGAIKELRCGRGSAVQSWLKDAKADLSLWQGITAEVRAKAMRTAAMVLVREGDIDQGSRLIDEADSLAPAPDRAVRTILVRVKDGLPAAISYLTEPANTKELEIKAALLIESEAADQALRVLQPIIGDGVTAEVLRLRAIAEFISGDYEKALNLAVSSTSKGGDEAAPRFTLATIRFGSALAKGVAIQFGGSPDPVSRSLVRSNPDALKLLFQAAEGFDQLLPHLDGEFRRDVEVWKLAALILNPDTQAEARRYARSLLSREDLEPASVAWCLHSGFPMRRGKIKKRLGDALRRGTGTPGHVVVLALMASKLDDAALALAILDRFGPDFPEAAEFFAHWRMQFGEDAGAPEETYSAGIRWAISKGDYAPLLGFLKSEQASVENVMSGAEFLSSRNSFESVDGLRDKLLAIDTFRAIELAARAASNTGKHKECLSILDQASSMGAQLPRPLVYLRLEAHEALSAHRHLINDLRGLLREREDAQLHDRLINAYLRIGALEEAKAEAEQALSKRTLDQGRAIQIAYALKSFAPDTARRALEQVQKGGIPKEMSGALLSLSSELGMETLQGNMIRRMLESPDGGSGLTRFDRVEDVMDLLRQQADGYRKVFGEWLGGKIPAAAAMRSDLKAYGLLFLGSPELRRNNIADAFPMLLLGQGARQQVEICEERPELRLDLGALLLADRLELLNELDSVFQVLVAESLPEALVALEAEYRSVSREVAEAIAAMERGDSAVRRVPSAPEGSGEIDHPEDLTRLDPGTVSALLNHAYRAGHLTRSQLNAVSEQLDLNGASTGAALPHACILLSTRALAQLARLDVLEPLARSFPMYLLQSDMAKLLDDLAVARGEEVIGCRVAQLRRQVAARLSSSAWLTAIQQTPEGDERSDALPAHVRCLLETFPRSDDADDSPYFWIEDRTLSKHRIAKALYLPDILNILVSRSALSAERYAAVVRQLRVGGYSFAPIDVGHIATIIEQAAIVDGHVVENSELASVRQWFATDVVNLQYIDPSIHLDAEGTIIGETRRTLDLGSMIKDLLVAIWTNADVTLEEKAARASWAWTSLRLEYVPSPPAADVPAARRQYAALVAVQAISIPLHAELGSVQLPESDRQPYVNWIMNFVQQMAEADPELRDDIVMLVASMVARILEDTDGIEEELLETLRAHMRAIVHGFLKLLPDDWYDSIAACQHIGEKLGRQRVVTLDLEKGIQIRVGDLADAITTAARSSGRASVPLPPGAGSAMLEMERRNGGYLGAVVTIGKRRWPLHPSTFALIHPDEDMRVQLLRDLPEEAGAGRPLSPEFLEGLASEPDVDRRVAAYTEALGNDFSRSLEAIEDRIGAGKPIRLKDIGLPKPRSLMNFLGLPEDFSGDYQQLVEDSSSSLGQKIGISAAIDRLCGLPCRLPEQLLKSFADNTSEGSDAFAASSSAFSSFTRVVSRASAGLMNPPDDVERAIGIFESNSYLFAALVRHGARQAVKNPDWSALPKETVVCLLWLYADHHSRVLAAAGLDVADFSRWLSVNNPSRLRDLERQDTWPRWARNAALKLTPARLNAAFVAEALRVGIESTPAMKSLAGHETDDAWLPHPDVAGAAAEAPTRFWAAADPVPAFIAAGWMPESSPFAARTDSGVVERLLQETANDQMVLALAIPLMTEVQELDQGILQRLRERLEEVLAANVSDRTEPVHQVLLEVISKILGIQRDCAAFNLTIGTIAKANAGIWPHARVRLQDDDGPGHAFDALANAAYAFAVACGGTFDQKTRRLAEGIETIVVSWPNSNLAAISCLDALVRQVDVPTAASSLWPVLMRLRARG